MTFEPTQPDHGHPLAESGQNIYFAYGSNLSFDQMARRCPKSRFVGRARLHKYAFQINQRGYANVMETSDPRSFVDGLCYRLSASDESSLDISEGVPLAYQKKDLEVEFFPAPDIGGMDVVDILRSRASNGKADNQETRAERGVPAGSAVKAMVYLSTIHVTPGRPRDEYIERMTRGFLEAVRQGIPTAYVDDTAKHWLNLERV